MSMTGISASENVDQTDSLGLSIEDNIETAEDELKIIRQTPGEVELKENENQTMNSNILGISNEDEILGAKDIYVKGDTFEDIQNAINGAETGDIIHLNGTYTNNLVKRIEINKNISIIGKDNATLDAEGQSSIFYVNSSKINIQDITFKNGNVRFIHPYLEIRSGGAIFFANAISNSNINATFINNKAVQNGGAIYFNGAVSNSNVMGIYTNNTVGWAGGANIFGSVSGSNVTGTYTNNKANYGGANFFRNNVSSNSKISGNYNNNNAEQNGGANYFNDAVEYTIIDGTYTNNIAKYYGGANIFGSVSGSNVTGTYTNNKANYGGANFFRNKVSSNSKISGNYNNNNAEQHGGANYFNDTVEYTIIDGTYENNTAKKDGGANFFSNNVSSNSKISGNYNNNNAEQHGGANNFQSSVSGSNVMGTYTNNKAEWNGGANRFLSSVSGSNVMGTYTNNTAKSLGGANCFWDCVSGSNIKGTYTKNKARNGGANFFWDCVSGSNVTGTYTKNKAEQDGGANIFGSVSDSNIGGTYTNNKAEQHGGANNFQSSVSASTVTGTYIKNTANIGTILFYNDEYFFSSFDAEIKNAIFLNNKCEYEIYTPIFQNDIRVNDCWFGNNASNFNEAPKTINVTRGNWLFLNATADYTSLLVMDSTNITFKLNSTNGQDVFAFDNSRLPAVYLTLTATKGDVEKTTTLDRAAKYIATEYGKGSVTASIENAKHTIFLDNRLNPEFSAEVNPQVIDYGNNTVIFLSYNDAATGTVNISLTGKKHSQKIENVDLNKTIGLPNTILPDEYELTVTYSGDKVFANANATSTLTVNKLKSDIKVVGHDIYVNETQGLMFNVKLPENATGNISINNERILNVTKEGRKENNSLIIEIMNNAYPVGKYEWTFTYSGDDIYESSKETSVANILIIPTEITANVTSKLFVDDTASISYNLTPDGAVGDIIFTSNDTGVVEVDRNGNIKAIAEGTALITVNFEGSENYTASSTDVTITVSKIPTEINITNATVELKAYQSIGDLATLNPARAGNLTYASSDEDIVLVSDDGIIRALIKGTATVTVSFAGDNKYKAAENKSITVNVILNDASVSVENDTLDLFVDDACIINSTANPHFLTVYYTSSDESVATVTDYGNVKAVGEGTAVITLTVGDDETYAINYTYVKVTVSKIPTEILIANETFDLNVNDKVDSGVSLNPSEAGNLTYIISEPSIIKLLDNQIIALSEGSATITYSFAGNDKYTACENKTITVKVILNDASVSVNNNTLNLFVGDTFTIVVNTTPKGLKVTYMPDNSGIISVDENGMVTALKEGTAPIIVKVGGDGVYAENTTTVTVTVKKLNPTMDLTAEDIIEGENATINVALPIDATGNVTTKFNGKTYSSKVENGKAIITIPDLEYGNYTLPITYSGDDLYNPTVTTVNITVNKNTVNINAGNLTKYYKDPQKFTVTVTDAKGQPATNKTVEITINGVTYTRTTDEKGTASLNINLNSGEYPVVVAVDDIKVNSSVFVKATIDASDVVKVFRNDTQYYARFVDVNGTPTPNTVVSFNVNGVIYNRATDENGTAKLNINLPSGEYILTATNTVTGEKISNVIKVLSVIESSDLTKYFRNASQFIVRIHTADGGYVGAGEEVKFNINGMIYAKKTNATGHAKININLAQGNYTVTTYYKDFSQGNSIEVLPILSAEDLSMKYMDGSQFKAQLVDGKGKPYPKQDVTFNINGVFYNRATGSDGVAKLNIRLLSGQYIITSTYNGCNIANKITIKS